MLQCENGLSAFNTSAPAEQFPLPGVRFAAPGAALSPPPAGPGFGALAALAPAGRHQRYDRRTDQRDEHPPRAHPAP